MLYPRESETRYISNISGIWKFKADFENKGRAENWQQSNFSDAINMPVPSSYNDITQSANLRDHIGDVWYRKEFFAPNYWQNKRIFIRFDSTTHHSIAWLNGTQISAHKGGYLPFEAEITELLKYDSPNLITVVVNNVLDWTTLPPGVIKQDKGAVNGSSKVYGATELDFSILPKGYKTQDYFHDFFNYAGIHRPVKISVLPQSFISDISVKTSINKKTGIIDYNISINGDADTTNVELIDDQGNIVASNSRQQGTLEVKNAKLWNPGKPYLYTLKATIYKNDKVIDIYRLPTGIRTIRVTDKEFLINGKPFYFKGFGKHEDMDIKGKGFDEAMLVKDFNLLQWTGANSFRTSHYPYAEEFLNLADELGIVVIDESPAVGQRFLNCDDDIFGDGYIGSEMLEHHKDVMRELIERDKNHPCVVMWSVANEPATFEANSLPYFQEVVEHTKNLDPTRPVTIVSCIKPSDCKVSHLIDVICVNYYFSWYTTPGRLEVIECQLEKILSQWHKRFKKPIIMAEYGADTIAGFHQDPPVMFTEEYQCELLERYHNVFDRLNYIAGEHVWNFADFAAKQEFGRVMGNKKGVFTRQRQPKAAAHLLRKRWLQIE